MRRSRLCLLALLLIVAGCREQKSDYRSNPLAKAIEEQKEAQDSGDSVEHRLQARQAAIKHVKKYYPEWEIQGVSIYSNAGSDYTINVDATSGDKRQSTQIDVELFVKDDGTKYWKTAFAPPRPEAKPFDFETEPYQPNK